MTFTERQGQVLELLACGKTDAEIAGAIGLSILTVQAHISKIREKLGVSGRALVVAAQKHLMEVAQ
jgi:DNA-binding NarL/FixJ family response regulator